MSLSLLCLVFAPFLRSHSAVIGERDPGFADLTKPCVKKKILEKHVTSAVASLAFRFSSYTSVSVSKFN